ncbi:MAG TPA: FAD binding domain-containing protein [Solirubrobacteraceae bacterium]|nr:FAD binding domain-containing protein [Solirubrobacteraceae bacterium]
MKPAPFRYAAPRSLAEALALLAGPEEATALAGGQSLVPMLNFRLARPELVVDLNPLAAELGGITITPEGDLRLGALTRHVELERSVEIAAGWPLLIDAVALVGHAAIRTRGTVGGSVAHADPNAELPVALAALGARFQVRSAAGARTLSSAELADGPLTTTLAEGELLCAIEVPALPAGAGSAFCEYARTHGDFALAGAAVVIAPGAADACAVALLGAAGTPVRAAEAEAALAAGAPDAEVAALAAAAVTGHRDDGGHQRALIGAMTARALARARERMSAP